MAKVLFDEAKAKELSGSLALSIRQEFQKNHYLLSRPVSTLARMSGLNVEEVYFALLPELVTKDLGNAIKFAETGLKYAQVIDRNRLREEAGESFIVAIELICALVKQGLDSSEKWIKRTAINLHGKLIDVASEKKRFVESLLVEDKLRMLQEGTEGMERAEQEILDFVEREGTFQADFDGAFSWMKQPNSKDKENTIEKISML